MTLREFYKRNCHSAVFKTFVGLGRAVNRFYENPNYDHRTNGERRVLQILSGFPQEIIFDVGANIGSWTRMAQGLFPKARFFCFEPVPETYEQLKTLKGAHTFNAALGSRCGQLTFHQYDKGHELSSVYSFELPKDQKRP